MQDILHTSIIAIPAIFAALMVLDLIATLKQAWSNYSASSGSSGRCNSPDDTDSIGRRCGGRSASSVSSGSSRRRRR
jgi:hypothetical protein